jgi:dynein regulatry complex protein 1
MSDADPTNIDNPDDRKAIRRERIEKRNAVNTISDDANLTAQTAQKSGQHQTNESLFHLDQRKHSGLQEVTSIRVAADSAESQRRMQDEELRRIRLGKLQNEAVGSAKSNAAIEMKWAELLESEIPQELHHEIQVQMQACNSVISSKDKLIGEFQTQLRAKDEEYVRILRHQGEEIASLLGRIRSEFKELRQEYEVEMETIENAYMDEREALVGTLTAEIDSLFEKRKNKENEYKESKQKREDMYQKEIEDLITRGADQHNKLKIELEMNIQTLKQQLEEIRATYQLNTEKLDYNYRVLTELDVEKTAELTRYKRRLTKLKDQLNQYVAKYTEMETADNKTNSELTEDYRRLTHKYKDLQAKFRHFEVADTQKYQEIWTMHDDEAKDLVDQLLKADKIMSEQLLGWLWKSPESVVSQDVLGRPAAVAGAAAPGDDGEASEDGARAQRRTVAGARVKGVLRMLTTEAGFLLNSGVQESLASLPSDEVELKTAEALLKALGVKTEEKLTALVNYFFKDNTQGLLFAEEAEIVLRDAPDDVAELRDMISPNDVISAVKNFIEDAQVAAGGNATAGQAGGTKGEDAQRIGQKILQNMRNYWDQLSQVVSDETVSVWKQLESDALTLKEQLEQRSKAISEVDGLNEKNAALKKLLNEYLGDRKNDYLQVPPAQTMRVRNIGISKTGKLPKGGNGGLDAKVLLSKTN